VGLRIVDLRLLIADLFYRQTYNRQSAIGNQETHPLPRGGTDFIQRL